MTSSNMTAHNIILANPADDAWTTNNFTFQLGAYGDTILMVFADHLGGAVDEMIDWAVEHEPDLLCDGAVADAYCDAIAAGHCRDTAHEMSLEDVTVGGNFGNCIMSHEWRIMNNNTPHTP
jgi:hypothetical protein